MKVLLPVVIALSISAPLSAQQENPLPPLPPDGFVTLEQIVSEFSRQPDAANRKYNGMRIVVYGRIGDVTESEDEEGDPLVVYLQLPDNPTPDVKCVFNTAGVPQGGSVNVETDDEEADFYKRNRRGDITAEKPIDIVGEMVGIRGTYHGFIAGDIVLKECGKLRDEAVERMLANRSAAP